MIQFRVKPGALQQPRRVMSENRIECEQVEARLTDFLEKSLSPRDYELIEAHLTRCARCRQTLHELETTIALLARLPKAKPPQPRSITHKPDYHGPR